MKLFIFVILLNKISSTFSDFAFKAYKVENDENIFSVHNHTKISPNPPYPNSIFFYGYLEKKCYRMIVNEIKKIQKYKYVTH